MRQVLVGLCVLALAAPAQAVVLSNFDLFIGEATADFDSAYAYTPSANTAAAQYTVRPDANPWNPAFASYPQPSGVGQYMVVNGAGSAANVWSNRTAVNLTAGVYSFSFALSDSCCNGLAYGGVDPYPPLLKVQRNGTDITLANLQLPANAQAGQWFTVSQTFTVTGGPASTFSIINNRLEGDGNDFGLDDITVTRVGDVPEPISWAMMVGGFGLMGATMRRRRTNVTFA